MDLINTVDSIGNKEAVYKGYESIRMIDGLENEAWCKRFKALYNYMRMKRSTYEFLENEPDWMTNLRNNFNRRYDTLLNESK